MGSLTKLINDLDSAKEDEQAQKERLQILLNLAKSRIEAFRVELDERFANPGLINKTQIPGTRALRYIEQYHVASRSEFNSQVGDHLTHAIDAFFSIGDGDNKRSVQEGLKQVIQTGLSGFIGSTDVGESQDRMYFVVPENNAFVRVDVVCWKYHFEQHKIINQSDLAVAYVLCKSVIDHTQITLDELIYLVTQALSSGVFIDDERRHAKFAASALEEVKAAAANLGLNGDVLAYLTNEAHWDIDAATKTIGTLRLGSGDRPKTITWDEFVSRVLSKDVPRIEKSKADANSVKLVFDGRLDLSLPPVRSTPASLQVVEGYINELTRVWKKLSVER